MDNYMLALDQGTTSTRALLVDRNGAIAGMAREELPLRYPDSGWVEADAVVHLGFGAGVIRRLLAETGVAADRIAGLGITNQRETTIVWDRETGEPVYSAIVWQSRQSADICARLAAAGHEAAVRERTGLRIDPYFSGTKVAWILENVPGARDRAEEASCSSGPSIRG